MVIGVAPVGFRREAPTAARNSRVPAWARYSMDPQDAKTTPSSFTGEQEPTAGLFLSAGMTIRPTDPD